MLTTNDEAIHKRIKIMRLHGIDRDVWDRFRSEKPSWEYDVVAPGYKYNMPDINAAIGLAQLDRAEEFRKGRQRCAEHYYRELGGLQTLDLPVLQVPREDHSWHLFPVILTRQSPVVRNEFIQKLAEGGIATSVHYKPIHRMTYYRDRYQLKPEDFPRSEKLWKGCVSLPIFPSMTNEELAHVTTSIREILG